MNDDKIRNDSELPENTKNDADSRFDVLDHLHLEDITRNDYSVGVESADAAGNAAAEDDLSADADFSDSDFDDILGELDEFERQMTGESVAAPVIPDVSAFEEAQNESREKNAPAAPEEKASPRKEREGLSDTGTIQFTHGEVDRAKPAATGAKKAAGAKPKSSGKGFSSSDVDRAAETISSLVESGKLSSALDLVLCLRGAFRQSVREKASITIPLGSRDSDLRRIAAGALIQSYLEQGKIVRRDIENKLFAIIESSEPEINADDEVVEQTEEDVLYKVTACMTFAAELTERSGNHPDEKRAMYASGDSVLDSFLADNIDEVSRTNKKRLGVLAEAIKASGGEVADKFIGYYENAKEASGSPIARFFGDSTAFRIAAAVVGLLCFITLILYIVKFPSSGINAQILGFVAKDNSPIMLFAIGAELFLTVGIALLCVVIGFGKKKKDQKNNR